MNGRDGMRSRGTVAGRCLHTGRRTVIAAVLLSGAVLGVAQPAIAAPAPAQFVAPPPAAVTCGGLTAGTAPAAGYTVRDNSASPVAVIVVGTPGPDWIVGSDFNDTLDGQGGGDLLCGRAGTDNVRGGSGDDRMFGGNGNDDLRGDTGTDSGNGGNGLSNTCDASTETRINC